MASKIKTCDFCGKRCKKDEMLAYEDKALLCDSLCYKMYIEAYIKPEVKNE